MNVKNKNSNSGYSNKKSNMTLMQIAHLIEKKTSNQFKKFNLTTDLHNLLIPDQFPFLISSELSQA